MTINHLFFGYFSFVIVLTSLLVITRRNPVHSILWMLVMFFHVAGLYLFLNAEFMAAIQIIVYAGAILVLYIFVIFLLDIRKEMKEKHYIGEWPLGFTVALSILIVVMIPMVGMKVPPVGEWSIDAINRETQTVALGTVLYTDFLFPFEVASLILLVAIIGTVVLAKEKRKQSEDK